MGLAQASPAIPLRRALSALACVRCGVAVARREAQGNAKLNAVSGEVFVSYFPMSTQVKYTDFQTTARFGSLSNFSSNCNVEFHPSSRKRTLAD